MSSNESKIIRCKGVVCWGKNEELKVEEIEVEAPKASEVRVKMLFASLCHSDFLCVQGFPFPLYPRVLGHEGVGEVESVGEGVTEVKKGDIVIPTYIAECSNCNACKSDETNLCLTYPLDLSGLMSDGSSRLSIKGQKLFHLFSCSTLSEYMVINSKFIVKINDGAEVENWVSHVGYLSCGFTTGFGAAWKEAKVTAGSTVAVFGLGAVGLGAIQGAKIHGATKIIGIDKNPNRKEKAEVFGMTDFINTNIDFGNKSISDLINDLTGGSGVDYSIECTGFGPLLDQAIQATKIGVGKTISVGVGANGSVEITHLPLLIGRTLKGSIYGGIKTKSDLPDLILKWKNKEIQLDELSTHEVVLEDINKAIELLKEPDCVKVLIKI